MHSNYQFAITELNATQNYDSLYQWSCRHRSDFWLLTFQYFPIVYTGRLLDSAVDESARIDSVPEWFRDVKLNFAENILYTGNKFGHPTKAPGKEDGKIACIGVREGSFLEPMTETSWGSLRKRVGCLSQAMRAHGVVKGDRIALVASTCLDSLTVFLAITAIGGIFSSSSTDMGTKGILERLRQIEPKYLFMDDWAVYNAKRIDLRPKMRDVLHGMRDIRNFRGIVSQSRIL